MVVIKIPLPDPPKFWKGPPQEWEQREVTRKVDDGEWREDRFFVCLTCHESCYLHPYTNRIWGCKKCGYTTASPSVYFGKFDVAEQTGRG